MNALLYISLFVLMASLVGVYLYNLQKDKVEQRLILSREEVQSELDIQFRFVHSNLQQLKANLQIFDLKHPNLYLDHYSHLTAHTINDHWVEYSGYFALERKWAQKLFAQKGMVLVISRNLKFAGQPQYLDPKTFEKNIFTDPNYQTDPREVWYHVGKNSTDVQFTKIYFDETYLKKWFISAILGIYSPRGEFQGVVGIDVLVDQLCLLRNWKAPGKTGGAVLVDTRTLQVIAQAGDSAQNFIRIKEKYQAPTMPKERMAKWNQLLNTDREIEFFSGENGKRYVVSAHRFHNVPMAILAFQEYNEAYAPAFRKFGLILLIGLSGFLLLLWMSAQFANAVTVPIRSLIESIEKNIDSVQKNENLTVNIESCGYLEVQRLSTLVNKLVRVVNNRMNQNLKMIEDERAKSIHSARMASIGRLAGNIAHEVNSPLTAIGLYTEVLMKDIESGGSTLSPTFSSRLHNIRRLTDRIAKIVHGLLRLSREGKSDSFKEISLAEVVSDTLNICQSKFRDSGIDLVVDPIPDAKLEGRGVQLSQVLLNLLNNAFDAVQDFKEKWVHIQFDIESSKVKIRVSDSGSGIPSEVADKMMDPFFTTKDVHRGTGLGLSISKSIVEEHHGHLYYDDLSEHTCFVMEVPKMEPNEPLT